MVGLVVVVGGGEDGCAFVGGRGVWEGEGGEVVDRGEDCADGDGEEGDDEECEVAEKDCDLVGLQAEMGFDGIWVDEGGGEGLAVAVDGIPHAQHEEAGLADAHGPAHTFDGDLAGIVFVGGVNEFAVVVVVARKHRYYVSDG